jgi:glycosidase
MKKPIIYQMLPRLWGNMNTNNTFNGSLEENGTGKFNNINKESLDYLKWMGCSHVWYTGVIRHSTKADSHPQFIKGNAGSPYAIKDYFDVNPYLAENEGKRMQEFEALIKRTHKAGLKVIIDFVPNHVARDYGKTVRRSKAPYVLGTSDDKNVHWSPDNDFFYYPGERLRLPNDAEYGDQAFYEYPAKATGNTFTPSPSENDWYETVKINYCNFHTSTWDKMAEIIRFWASKGVDGFRCDMVELVPSEFFQWLIPTMKQEFPDLIFIAEVYVKDLYRKYIEEVGFDYLYDKSGLYDSLRSIVEHQNSARAITNNWQFLGDLQPRMLNFLENHDEQRFASDFFGKDAYRSFAALYVSLFLNTSAFMLYFGEEVGEKGMDHEGFSGRDGRTTIFDWWSVKSLRDLYASIQKGKYTKSTDKVFKKYTKAMQLAASSKAVQEGSTYDLCWCNNESNGFNPDKHFAFLRHTEGETLLFVANFSYEPATIHINIPSHVFEHLGINDDKALKEGKTVKVQVDGFDGLSMQL